MELVDAIAQGDFEVGDSGVKASEVWPVEYRIASGERDRAIGELDAADQPSWILATLCSR